ncbi:hypothetical protein LWP59_04760 [Amycolatopsis acidiphila]|uniref:Rv3212 family protein n=1 Tax=Amycolatopsis acidiphila TaxID=715473 RepID=UPI001643CA60|nr:hypothetical protein [Amycolatopsis acidiphila]UIJ60980.1 hypothetical protein LWP59_04760 [Amycolatopsis acidiphila]
MIIGVEDVLAGAGKPPLGPPRRHTVVKRDRRSPWNRPRDRVIAAVIAVIAVAAGVTVWANSESRATVSQTADPGPALPEAATAVPAQLSELWQAPSAAAPVPIAEGNAAVTANGGELDGRDPLTGQVRWRYSRDLPLCTAAEGWARAVALYRNDGVNGETGCSEVVALDPGTGHRMAQRTGSAPLGTGLVSDGAYVTAFGTTLLNTWRDDLVETAEYGKVPALVNPDKQPRVGCTYGSIAMASSRVGVVERCPNDPGDRITVFRAAPKESDSPQVSFSEILPGYHARMVAMSGDYVAVAMPDQKQLVLYGPDGAELSAYPLDLPASDLDHDPAGGVPATSSTAANVYWFTGSKLMAFARDTLTPKWTLSSALGPGVLFDHQLVVPIQGGLAVLNEEDGSTIRTIGVDRHGYTGPVRLAALGPVLLEQRGATLAALR